MVFAGSLQAMLLLEEGTIGSFEAFLLLSYGDFEMAFSPDSLVSALRSLAFVLTSFPEVVTNAG